MLRFAWNDLFNNLVQIDLTVSVVALLLFFLRKTLKKRYPARVMCMVWAVLALRLLVPVQLTLPDPPVQVAPRTTYFTRTDFTSAQMVPDEQITTDHWITQQQAQDIQQTNGSAVRTFDIGRVLFALWGVGTLAFVVWQGYQYLMFGYMMRRNSYPTEQEMLLTVFAEQKRALHITRNIQIQVTAAADCQMLAGFVRPVLYLPDQALSEQDAVFIFRHELTHYKRRDLWLKLILVAVQAVHWFNPLIHQMARFAQEDIEIACDEAVVRGMDVSARRAYGQTILRSVEKQIKKRALVSRFTGDKEGLMRRFEGLFDKSIKKRGVALVVGAAVLVSALGCAFSVGENQAHFTQTECIAMAEQWMSGNYRDAEPWYEMLESSLAQKLYEQQKTLGAQTGLTDGEPLWEIGTSSPSVSRFTVIPDAENQQAVIVTEWAASSSMPTRQAERIHFKKIGSEWKVSQVEGNPYINDKPFVDTADSLDHFRILYENDLGLPGAWFESGVSLPLEEAVVKSLQLTGGQLESVRSWDETGDGDNDMSLMRYTFADGAQLDLTIAGGNVQDYTYDGGKNNRTAADLAQQYARAVAHKSVWPAYPVLSTQGQQQMADSQRALAGSEPDGVWYTKYGGSSPTVTEYVLTPGKEPDTYVAVFQLHGGGMTDYRSAIAITTGKENGRMVITQMERCDEHLSFIQEQLSGQDSGYTMSEIFGLYYDSGLPWPALDDNIGISTSNGENQYWYNGQPIEELEQPLTAVNTIFSAVGETYEEVEGNTTHIRMRTWFTSEAISEGDAEAVVRLHFSDNSPSVDVQMRKTGDYWLPVGFV